MSMKTRVRGYILALVLSAAWGLTGGFSTKVLADADCSPGCCKDRVTCGGSGHTCCNVPSGQLPCDVGNDCPGICDCSI